MYQSEDMIRPSPTVESEPSIKYEESWDGVSIHILFSIK